MQRQSNIITVTAESGFKYTIAHSYSNPSQTIYLDDNFDDNSA